ncbi:MAG: LysM peptidoglycan-binding domain-containing protein, partial [Anaerolineae bacterium]|nr:LysM peptidoglycan-binding domain-containing protein [Anaerolineae bacterium]
MSEPNGCSIYPLFALLFVAIFAIAGIAIAPEALFGPAIDQVFTDVVPGLPATPIPQPDTLTVSGQLVMGTAGAVIPSGQVVQLMVVDPNGSLGNRYETTAGVNGAYTFEGVLREAGSQYIVWLDYDGITQAGSVVTIEGSEDRITADVTVYEKTDDPAAVVISSAQVLVNYTPVYEVGIEIWLNLQLTNTGDRIVLAEPNAETEWAASTRIELPVGAFGIQPIQYGTTDRFQVKLVGSTPVVYDTWPLRPGQTQQIAVAYYLPYQNGAVLDHAFGYPLADATILLPNDTVTFQSGQFDPEGAFEYRMQPGVPQLTRLGPDEALSADDPTLVRAHSLLAPLGADTRMVFSLIGTPTRTVTPPPTPTPPASSTECPSHTVQAGDMLFSIAMMYGVSVNDMLAANGLDETSASQLQIGQMLIIPVPGCQWSAEPPPAAAPPAGTVLIEAVFNPGDVTTEAVEIRNAGQTISLQGWMLLDEQGHT